MAAIFSSTLVSRLRLLLSLALFTSLSCSAAIDSDVVDADLLAGLALSSLATQTNATTKSTWCIAKNTVDDSTLQAALTYACGQTTADCSPIKLGGPCFLPNTVAFHASYVFNSYYQMHAKASGTCSFGNSAEVTTDDPSNGSCIFPSSGSLNQTTLILLTNVGSLVSPGLHILLIILFFMQWY